MFGYNGAPAQLATSGKPVVTKDIADLSDPCRFSVKAKMNSKVSIIRNRLLSKVFLSYLCNRVSKVTIAPTRLSGLTPLIYIRQNIRVNVKSTSTCISQRLFPNTCFMLNVHIVWAIHHVHGIIHDLYHL